MKQIILLFFLNVFVLVACKKDVPIQPSSLSGTWKWIYTLSPNPNYPDSTPSNTGKTELMIFNIDNTWKKNQNNSMVDSGTYSIGHGHYLPYVGAYDYIYDSIVFYKRGIQQGWDAYKILSQDTLVFGPGIAGSFSSYTLPYNGSKWWIKQ